MPWKEVRFMDERVRFIARLTEGERMTDLCREFGITRKTGYKFLSRYNKFGVEGLNNQSRRPFHLARKTSEESEKLIIRLKGLYPTWGPKKLLARLEILHPGVHFPVKSTIGEILDRHGLVKNRKRERAQEKLYPTRLSESSACNDVWCTDFKGQFRLGNQNYCYPLTVTDHFSRYLIGCEALTTTKTRPSIAIFEELFDQYGLPVAIKSDNGVPFSSQSFAGLSELSAWWMSLGIQPQRSRPGCPQDNGRHERMHRTLKAETTRPAGQNQLQQQERFDDFKERFNQDRPHEALEMKTPASIYTASKRTLVEAQKELCYPMHDFTRLVSPGGTLKINGQKYFIGSAIRGHQVGVRNLSEGLHLISLGPFDLGYMNLKTHKFTIENPLTAQEEQ
jgi:transposase InsO family protein